MIDVAVNLMTHLFTGLPLALITIGTISISGIYMMDYRNQIEKTINELEGFDESIRYLPLSDQKTLRAIEVNRRQKEHRMTRKILFAGATTFTPVLVWGGLCLYNNTVFENFRLFIGLLMLSPAVMLAMEFFLNKNSH